MVLAGVAAGVRRAPSAGAASAGTSRPFDTALVSDDTEAELLVPCRSLAGPEAGDISIGLLPPHAACLAHRAESTGLSSACAQAASQ
jgi:hypothetical protein